MIYQIMYPIMDNSTTMEGQHITSKQGTVDANVLSGTCTVLAPAKAIAGKKQIYSVVEKQNQYTNTEVVTVEGIFFLS